MPEEDRRAGRATRPTAGSFRRPAGSYLVQPKRKCPKGRRGSRPEAHGQLAERTVIDLVFTRNGCRKTVTRYDGKKSRCPKCEQHYNPPASTGSAIHTFGHGFQAWTVYQRVVLRLPYRIITQVTEHLFGVGLSTTTRLSTSCSYLADYYAPTEAAILQAILKSDFVHVDETKINIQGVDHYVWVFTDGKHVVFRMTETREADIVREVLAGYQGVLVSDFYPGYDGDPVPATEMPRPPHPRHQRRPLEGSVRQGTGGVRRGGPGPARADPGGG